MIPVIGAQVAASPLSFLHLRGSAVGTVWDYSNVEAADIDAEGSIRIEPPPALFAGLGYRHLAVEVVDDEELIDLDFSFSGPVAYVGLDW